MATNTSNAERDEEYEETFDTVYGDEAQADFDEGPQAEYGDDVADPDAQEGTQEWYARKQK